jgi:hypothetical protein
MQLKPYQCRVPVIQNSNFNGAIIVKTLKVVIRSRSKMIDLLQFKKNLHKKSISNLSVIDTNVDKYSLIDPIFYNIS